MDILSENYHYVDALSYIDNEYENPVVKSYVDSLIMSEMSSSSKTMSDYLSLLPPLPTLKYANMKNKSSADGKALDMKRYEISQPEPSREKNIDAWKLSVSNAKSQLENQNNRLLNLELCEKNVANIWLKHNNFVEHQGLMNQTINDKISKELQLVNFNRKEKQEKAKTVLDKMLRRRDESVVKAWQIEISCRHIENSLITNANAITKKHRVNTESEQDAKRVRFTN